MLISRNQCFSGDNKEKVVLARGDLLRKEVASQKWDSIKLVCSQASSVDSIKQPNASQLEHLCSLTSSTMRSLASQCLFSMGKKTRGRWTRRTGRLRPRWRELVCKNLKGGSSERPHFASKLNFLPPYRWWWPILHPINFPVLTITLPEPGELHAGQHWRERTGNATWIRCHVKVDLGNALDLKTTY